MQCFWTAVIFALNAALPSLDDLWFFKAELLLSFARDDSQEDLWDIEFTGKYCKILAL